MKKTTGRIGMVSFAAVVLAVAAQPGRGWAGTLETLTDRCSTSVRVVPALIFDANKGKMVPGSQAPIRLHRESPNHNESFTPSTPVAVGLLSSGHVRWFCGAHADQSGGTAERSRCPSGTNALQARLGPDRLLEIRCDDGK
jgi:hypothetical protein